MNRPSGHLAAACAQWSTAISSAVVVAPENHLCFERIPTGARCDEGAGHLRAQLAHARRDGCTQTRVMFHESHAPENPSRFRSVDAIQGANDRLTSRIAERICAKAVAQLAEEHRVVLIPEHEPFFGAEMAVDGRRRHKRCFGDFLNRDGIEAVLFTQPQRCSPDSSYAASAASAADSKFGPLGPSSAAARHQPSSTSALAANFRGWHHWPHMALRTDRSFVRSTLSGGLGLVNLMGFSPPLSFTGDPIALHSGLLWLFLGLPLVNPVYDFHDEIPDINANWPRSKCFGCDFFWNAFRCFCHRSPPLNSTHFSECYVIWERPERSSRFGFPLGYISDVSGRIPSPLEKFSRLRPCPRGRQKRATGMGRPASRIERVGAVEEDGSLEEVKRIVKLLHMAPVCQG